MIRRLVLALAVVLVLAVVAQSLPDLARYLKLRSM
jgi:hypothetical protein